MKKTAFIFPGQGAQAVGMGKDLYENFNEAKCVFDNANKILGKNISKICFEGPEEDLKQTTNTQPAILTTSIAALEVLKSKLDIKPSYLAGHSLGEYAALYASGALTFENTIKLIAKRAEEMNNKKGGAMSAVLGLSDEVVAKCVEIANSTDYVGVANYNCPGQVVITGSDNGIKKAGELLTAEGAKRVIPLAVSGAFHSNLMEDASSNFGKYLKDYTLNNAEIPVITNVDAKITTGAEEIKSKMPKQIKSSVQWTKTIQKMIENGVDTFIEIGPGKVLAGLNRKIDSSIKTYNVYDKKSIELCVSELQA